MAPFECAVIGAGAAGLSTSLVLGRARRKVVVFDNHTNRNRVTQKSHGFLTRDGIEPDQFKRIGLAEIRRYPTVQYVEQTVTSIVKQPDGFFHIDTAAKQSYQASKIVLATGIQEKFPSIPNIKQYYGKSLFSCPYCDGYELRDQPLIVIAEKEKHALHLGKLVYQWSKDLIVATHGNDISSSMIEQFNHQQIQVQTQPIQHLHGQDGYLEKIEFATGEVIERTGGFVVPTFYRPNQLAEQLHCQLDEKGRIVIDHEGRTSQKDIYVAGETMDKQQSSLIIAAAEGNKVAATIHMDLINERFG